ncbi:hypothetical protein GQ55_8G217800 [Panicum hallii var. hallii]|uniref:Uncharacterized protein n=1 Tax=Panicum hallii var. hallii TaxID=1504633 RepID=A0A2T7CPV2_9POAL|nr:hypothetical protein GQ55_8G217800 [Panicum hallii var. hallii]
MKPIEEPTPPGERTSGSRENKVSATVPAMPNTYNTEPTPPDDGSPWSLDDHPEVFQQWEAQAYEINRQAKAKVKIGIHDTPPSAVASSSKQNDTGPPRTASAQVLRTQPAIGTTPGAAAEGKTEGDSSRMFKAPAALQSPYVEVAKKVSFKCSKDVSRVYNAVCMCSGRPTRSNNRKAIIMNYLFNFAVLGDLVDSVKLAGKLKNTIADIGIYVLNGKKTRGATRFVMPLYVSTLLQSHQMGMAAVQQAFKKDTNHLDYRQLVSI